MTLLQNINGDSKKDRSPALQAVFERRYAWLLRWALHFTENDRAQAEDLVQETFVRLLLSWDTLRDLDDLEPLLYSYLRYEHLSERRRGRNHAFQRLSTADFDTLAISLRSSSAFDQIEVQNEIRQVLAFLLWRRRTARFASIFLLRFFHGYFPEEIASVCIAKRVAVDLGLSQARRELKAHLADPRQIHVMSRSPFPDQKPVNIAIPIDDFEKELRRNIFHSHIEPCPPLENLERAYNSLSQRPIESGLLTHIVVCEPCLEKAVRHCNIPPPSSRSINDSFRRSPRTKLRKPGLADKRRLARVFAEGESRMREIYEHHPTGLVIALNAQVVAVRDISSTATHAMLKVETHTVQTLEIIEVLSEQGLLLMAMPVLRHPPKSQPEIRHEIELSGARTLTLLIRFNGDGALIEATYADPHCSTLADEVIGGEEVGALSDVCSEDDFIQRMPGARTYVGVNLPTTQTASMMWLWHRFAERLKIGLGTVTPLVTASAVLLAAIAWLAWIADNRQAQRIDANQILRAATRSEDSLQHTNQQGVIHQAVRIETGGRGQNRDLYRDLRGKRRPRQLPMSEEERVLRAKLTEAQMDWNNPLSAESYRDWHDHLLREEDQVVESGKNLLTVTTKVRRGSIQQETLTIELDDFHPVARTVLFRGGDTVEVAELSYEILPWGPKVDTWFESDFTEGFNTHPPTGGVLPKVPSRLNEAQVDFAELSTILALQELRADTERLQVTRTPSGVDVLGIVESDQRKTAIILRLQTIAHVKASISSYRDLDAKAPPKASASQVHAVSAAVEDTPLKAECSHEKMSSDQCRRLSYALLDASSVLIRESKSMNALRQEYPAARPLTSTAQQLLVEIVEERLGHMHAALEQQKRVLQSLSVDRARGWENRPAGPPILEDAAQRNLSLCKELVYVADEHSRPAPIILEELAQIVDDTRIALARTAADFGANSIPPSPYATPGQ
jgi:DNA-directed RNA polymerase specialized sigma24 family protein